MRLLTCFAAVYAGALLVMTAVHILAPQRDGPLAMTQVFAPHLFLVLVVALGLVLLSGGLRSRAVVVLAIVVGLARFGPGMVSLPAVPMTANEAPLNVMAWNVSAGEVAAQRLVERLLESRADVVGLSELGREHVAAIESSADLVARFPHRLLHPDDSVLGMGLLSIHPLTERSNGRNPPHVHADMRLRDGLTVSTLVGHPLPPKFGTLFDVIPTGYVASERDASISLLRVKVASDLAAGTPVIVLGDFNVTDREPAYHDLTAGLKDAHLEVGFGPGSTWRPARFAGVPLGVLRIDYVLVGGAVRPLTVAADCASSGSDHCIVESTLAVASP